MTVTFNLDPGRSARMSECFKSLANYASLTLRQLVQAIPSLGSIASAGRYAAGDNPLPPATVAEFATVMAASLRLNISDVLNYFDHAVSPSSFNFDDFIIAEIKQPTREDLTWIREAVRPIQRRHKPRFEILGWPPLEAIESTLHTRLIAAAAVRFTNAKEHAIEQLRTHEQNLLSDALEDDATHAKLSYFKLSSCFDIAHHRGAWADQPVELYDVAFEWLLDVVNDRTNPIMLVDDTTLSKCYASLVTSYSTLKLYGDELIVAQYDHYPTRAVFQRRRGIEPQRVIAKARALFDDLRAGSGFTVLNAADATRLIESLMNSGPLNLRIAQERSERGVLKEAIEVKRRTA